MSSSIQINAVTNVNKRLCVHKYIHTNKYIEDLNNNNKHKRKKCLTICIYKRLQKYVFRCREREPSISGTFATLNVFDYKRAEQNDHKKTSS